MAHFGGSYRSKMVPNKVSSKPTTPLSFRGDKNQPSQPLKSGRNQFEVRRTQSFNSRSFQKEQSLPKLPANDFNACEENPHASKILHNLVDILTTWGDFDWRQLAFFDEQLRNIFDTFEFRDLDLKTVYMCIGVASIMPLAHFPSLNFNFSPSHKEKNNEESVQAGEEGPSSLEEYALVAAEKKKNWVLETRMMAAEMSCLEAKLANDESLRKESEAMKRAKSLEDEVVQLKDEIDDLKSKLSHLSGLSVESVSYDHPQDNTCEENVNLEESDVNVCDILRELQQLRSEIEVDKVEEINLTGGDSDMEDGSIDQILTRQREILAKAHQPHDI